MLSRSEASFGHSFERSFVSAAAGAVGSAVVQIAKARGMTVIGSAGGADKCEFVRSLGADHVIDYTREDVGAAVRDVDVVLDLVGGQTGLDSLPVIRDGGLLISVPSQADVAPLREAARDRVRVTGILVEPDRTGMEAIAGLAADGRLRVRVARTFPLEQAAAAHELLEKGRAGGKLVLTID